MSLAQYYKVIGNGRGVTPDMEPGMFTFANDGTSVLGFIYKVEDYSLELVMFEPSPANQSTNLIVLAPYLSTAEVANKLSEALASNPKMAMIWDKYFNEDPSSWEE